MYQKLDALIIQAIQNSKPPLYEKLTHKEALRIEMRTGRYVHNIIDGRLKALKRQKRIVFLKSTIGRKAAWYVL